MKTLFFLKAKCGRSNRDFYIRHDFAADDRWAITYGLKEIPAGDNVGNVGMQFDYGNVRTGPQYKCPHCGGRNIVKCGACGGYACHPGRDVTTHFKCPNCGHEGEINGYIETVESGNTGSGQ